MPNFEESYCALRDLSRLVRMEAEKYPEEEIEDGFRQILEGEQGSKTMYVDIVRCLRCGLSMRVEPTVYTGGEVGITIESRPEICKDDLKAEYADSIRNRFRPARTRAAIEAKDLADYDSEVVA